MERCFLVYNASCKGIYVIFVGWVYKQIEPLSPKRVLLICFGHFSTVKLTIQCNQTIGFRNTVNLYLVCFELNGYTWCNTIVTKAIELLRVV